MSSDLKRGDNRRQAIFVVVGVLVSMLLVLVFSQVTATISANITYDATLSLKQSMLQETVDNFIRDLELDRVEYEKQHPKASKDEAEDALRQIAHDRIYAQSFNDGAYMWVQKVLDFDGGDNYAIRLIHPNLSETEGQYLSTNEVNSSGAKAYEEELEGIKANGHVFLTYDFKKLNSEEVTSKVTYSTLYDAFDWIVCMGVNIDDLGHYEERATRDMMASRIIALVAIAIVWTIVLLVMSGAYKRFHIRAYEQRNKELREKLDFDPLTTANSRGFGEQLLEREFEEFKSGKRDTLLLMMDVDFFKEFNDTYGHEVGDQVLQSVVAAVRGSTRDSDSVIRWGGDEFIVVLQKVPPEAQPVVGDKILEAVRAIVLPGAPDARQVTTSMGFAYFEESDTGIEDAMNRADTALYKAKECGRNNWKIAVGEEGVPSDDSGE